MASETATKFNEVFEKYKASIKQTMNYAQEASYLSLVHFSETGDTTCMRNFYDATPKNFGRKEAFLKWSMAYSPLEAVTDEKGDVTWRKSKADDAKEFDLVGANSEPFWEFAPDNTTINFDTDKIVGAMEKTLKRFHNKNYNASSEHDVQALAFLEKQVQALKGRVNAGEHLKDDGVNGHVEKEEGARDIVGTLSDSTETMAGEKAQAA